MAVARSRDRDRALRLGARDLRLGDLLVQAGALAGVALREKVAQCLVRILKSTHRFHDLGITRGDGDARTGLLHKPHGFTALRQLSRRKHLKRQLIDLRRVCARLGIKRVEIGHHQTNWQCQLARP